MGYTGISESGSRRASSSVSQVKRILLINNIIAFYLFIFFAIYKYYVGLKNSRFTRVVEII